MIERERNMNLHGGRVLESSLMISSMGRRGIEMIGEHAPPVDIDWSSSVFAFIASHGFL
jgi:hypothetical protein